MDQTINLKSCASLALLLAVPAGYAQETIDSAPSLSPDQQVVPVADDEPAEAVDYAVPEPTDDPTVTDVEMLQVQFERYKQLMRDGVHDEADSVAKRVIELAIKVSGPRSNDTARALTNLAIVQHRTKQFEAAQQNFQAAVDIIEDNEDRLNGQLVNPLKGLGAAQLGAGRPDLASDTFRRAVHVTHVNEGPHNLDQISILESLAEANLQLGSIDIAKQVQDMIYAINTRYYAGDALSMVPALMRRAAWQHRAGFIYDERTTYRRVIRIIEEISGKNDLQLVKPLTKLGQSFFYVDTSGTTTYQQTAMTTGEIYFKRAVRIATEHPDSDWQTVATTTLALGDYYMFEGSEQRARTVYQDAWDLLSEDEERYDYRREELEELVTLRERPIPQYLSSTSGEGPAALDDNMIQGTVAVTYVISSRGRAADVKILEAEPVEFDEMLRNVQRELRRRIYRPQFGESGPITSPEQVLTHRFYYRQVDLDALQDSDEAPEDNLADQNEATENNEQG